jgi:antirestriction protein ArdC
VAARQTSGQLYDGINVLVHIMKATFFFGFLEKNKTTYHLVNINDR